MDSLHNIHVRILNQDDFEKLKMFHVKHFPDYEISDKSFVSYLSSSQYQVGGAFWNEEIVGHVIFLVTEYQADIIYIGTHKEYRNLGIGTRLLNSKCFTWNIGFRDYDIFLEVAVDNFAAIQFYKKQDFTIVSVRKNYHNSTDYYVMQKQIRKKF